MPRIHVIEYGKIMKSNQKDKIKMLNNCTDQKSMNCFLTLPMTSWGMTLSTLKLTVLHKGLHSPITIMSPSFTVKAGEQ